MTTPTTTPSPVCRAGERDGSYGVPPADVPAWLGVDPPIGLIGQQARELPQWPWPNALPEIEEG